MAAEGSNGRPADDRVALIFSAFMRDVFTPLIALSDVSVADRRRVLAEIRSRLDIVEEVVDTCDAAGLASAWMAPSSALETTPADDASAASDGGLGRNQRSRVRELVILEILARDAKAVSLQQILTGLERRGFEDSNAAVVSQLHRLKKLELVRQPAGSTGMYEITTAGLGHARDLRASFGAYAPA